MAESKKPAEESLSKIDKSEGNEKNEAVTFNAPECPVEKVVVYRDRAEVCRVIETSLKKGENEVIVKKISQFVDQDSIRVEGKGPATILEVTYQNKYITPTNSDTEENKSRSEELRREMTEYEEKLLVLQAAKARVQKQWKVLEQFSDSVTKMGASVHNQGDAKTTVTRLDKSQLEGITDFFDLYETQSSKFDAKQFELDKQMKVVQEQRSALRRNMQELGIHKNAELSRQCSILLECTQTDAKVTLHVSYVVSNAFWTPKYDIRVFPEEKKLKVMYYGVIQQSTEEDWDNAKLFLSTAMPSIGGIMPTLGRSTVNIRSRIQVRSNSYKRDLGMAMNSKMRAMNYMCDEEYLQTDSAGYDPPMPAPMQQARSEAKEGLTSTTFEITRNTSIPSDNVGHKVTVGIIDLTPKFEYETVPVLAPHAFLKARVTNNSQYSFLPGQTNIFLDNNFVATSELKAVSPAEEFLVSLGVDPAVRVTYKPLSKYQEKSGLLTKVTTVTYKQDIEVKNTHKDLVNIKVIDSVPISTEDKIKVNILEPSVKVIKLTKDNHVEWQIDVKGTEKREITLKYTIEYPAGEEIDTVNS